MLSVRLADRPSPDVVAARDAGIPKSKADDRLRMYTTTFRTTMARASTPIMMPPICSGLRTFESPPSLVAVGGRPGASVIGGDVGSSPSKHYTSSLRVIITIK